MRFARRNGGSAHACTVKLRETGIVLPRVPIATGVIGWAALPAEGDLVVVIFAGGDMHAPIVAGRLYNEAVSPPVHGPGEVVAVLPGGEEDATKSLQLTVKTPGDGSRALTLLLDGSVQVRVDVDDDGVRLKTQETELTLSDDKAELKVADASVTVKKGGDLTIEASGTLTLKGTKVEISGDASVKVAGQTIDLN